MHFKQYCKKNNNSAFSFLFFFFFPIPYNIPILLEVADRSFQGVEKKKSQIDYHVEISHLGTKPGLITRTAQYIFSSLCQKFL